MRIARRISHPLYKKIITRYKNFHAHDEKNEAQVGDLVRIMETRPLSKTKRWRLAKIVQQGELALANAAAAAAKPAAASPPRKPRSQPRPNQARKGTENVTVTIQIECCR